MSWRSRTWWAAALLVSTAQAVHLLTGSETSFGMFGFGPCPGQEIYFELMAWMWPIYAWLPLVWYGGAPAVVIAFLAYWWAVRRGRDKAGRVIARVLAGLLLTLNSIGPLAFAADLAIERGCVESWGGLQGVWFFLGADIAPLVAAFCVLAAVRVPKHRIVRVLRASWFRRGAAGLAVLGLLAFLPAADLISGGITKGDCEPDYSYPPKVRTGERAFLCQARSGDAFARVSDRDLLAYGRAMCDAYPGKGAEPWLIAPICPAAARYVQAQLDSEEAAYQAQDVAAQKTCDMSPHRPPAKPVEVTRRLMWTDYGVLESYEYTEGQPDPYEDGLLEAAQRDGLVAALPGHLMILSHSDYDICVTAETYRKRPPLEVKTWDHVVEVGYRSPTGQIELRDPMGGDPLPNLAFRGKGHYRIRVHYREPDWEAFTPQHILIMIYPGSGQKTVVHRPTS
ncbi:hypothetical protein [Acrocarpospora catenulata]|uniref:hypothetical protein n=1 Tax=Acrocarpospora catenulata TaxID=2836182 RepID=UPI001BD9695E|nr:hypothetical protein [Acrocarpospora catenulata]